MLLLNYLYTLQCLLLKRVGKGWGKKWKKQIASGNLLNSYIYIYYGKAGKKI